MSNDKSNDVHQDGAQPIKNVSLKISHQRDAKRIKIKVDQVNPLLISDEPVEQQSESQGSATRGSRGQRIIVDRNNRSGSLNRVTVQKNKVNVTSFVIEDGIKIPMKITTIDF